MRQVELYVQGVSVGFAKRAVVGNVGFRCTSGTITAIVGTNGSGKTTLLRALAGIHPLIAGDIRVGSQDKTWDVEKLKGAQRAKCMAMVAQEEHIPLELTVKELVMLGRLPHATPWELSSKKHEAVVQTAIAECGLESHIATPCGSLSGGLRRRALIARGFAQETPLLLLDEPTNHLDIYHQLSLLELLRASGKTVVLTLHDLDLALGYADQVVVLHQTTGTATQLFCGQATEALQDPILQQVFAVRGLQFEANNLLQRSHLLLESLRKDEV